MEILTEPADDYVRDFIGEGAAIRLLGLLTAGEVGEMGEAGAVDVSGPAAAEGTELRVDAGASVYAVLEKMLDAGADHVVISGSERRLTLRDLLLTAGRAGGGKR